MKIESQDQRIDQLLKGNTFLIPRFQRAYSWEADHITDFWADILENITEAYFIGSMVVYTVDRSTLAVVDGQQRLTTITILLCAIRDGFTQLGRSDLADGLQTYIEQKNRENETVYILKTETSFPYLQEVILKNGIPNLQCEVGREEAAIEKAFSIFSNKISSKFAEFFNNKEQTKEDNTNDATKWLIQVRDAVFDLNVILITLGNEDDAYLIFETLNTRGKDLALSDLLRNHFSKYIKPEKGVDHAKIKWGRVLDTISNAPMHLDPDTFIVHSWQSRYDFATKAKIFTKLKKIVDKRNANGHLDRFVSDAGHWRSIFDTEYNWGKKEKEIARSLSALRLFKVVQPTPGILSLIRAYRDEKIKLGVLRKALEDIEYFHFSFNAITSSRSSGGISGMYSSFGRQVFSANGSNEVGLAISELKAKLQSREAISSEFNAGFEQVVFTKNNSSQKGLVQYILKKTAIYEGQPTIGDTDDLTIEHLLPQSSAKAGVSEQVIGQLGNLILVDSETNNMLSTKGFKEKKLILESRGYKLPDLLKDAKKIDADVIAENTARLSELARMEIWKI